MWVPLIQIKRRHPQKANSNKFGQLQSFLIATLISLIFCVLGCTFISLKSKAPVWIPYDREKVNQSLNDGRIVVLFGNPMYHVDGKLIQHYLRSEDYVDSLVKSDATLYYVEFSTGREATALDFMEMTRRGKDPILAILSTGKDPKYFSVTEMKAFKEALLRISEK